MISPDVFFIFFLSLIFWAGSRREKHCGWKDKKWSKIKNNYIRHAPYLRNRTLSESDLNFWYTSLKWGYLQAIILFFQNFEFLDCCWWKGKKWPQKKSNYICHARHLRNCTSSDHNFWYTSVKWWYLQVCFSFFQILSLRAVRGKGDEGGGKISKNGPEWKITIKSNTCHNGRNNVAYDHIWSWFLVHYSKMMISSGFFSLFLNFDFLGYSGGKSVKNSPKWKITIKSITCHI